MILDLDKSKLIDMRDCQHDRFKEIIEEMRHIGKRLQPFWFRTILRWKYLSKRLGGGIHGTRNWEYPWSVLNAGIKPGFRILDAGCGCSPLLVYLAKRRMNCFGVDSDEILNIHEIGIHNF